MTKTEVVLAVVSVASSIVSFYSFYLNEKRRNTEQANIEIMKEKFRSLHDDLRVVLGFADQIVQIPKLDKGTRIEELQNYARFIRHELLIKMKSISNESKQLENWQQGLPLKSSPIELLPSEKEETQSGITKPVTK